MAKASASILSAYETRREAKAAKKRQRKEIANKHPSGIAGNLKADVYQDQEDNPFFYGDGNPHKKVVVLKNRRVDPLLDYTSRKFITHEQAKAGLHFQQYYCSSGATIQAMDPTKEPVDGGGAGDAFTDKRVNALKVLIDADRVLGRAGYMLIEQVCGHGVFVNAMTRTDHENKLEMQRLRNCLDILARFWGFV